MSMSKILTIHDIELLKINKNHPKNTKARIVPYKIVDGSCYFLFCKEHYNKFANIGTYNMLGGFRDKDETIFECAERELFEETLGVVPFKTPNIILKRNRRYIMFMDISNETNIIYEFKKRLNNIRTYNYNNLPNCLKDINCYDTCYNEIDDLVWVNEKYILHKDIYKSVVDIFKTIIDDQKNIYNINNFMNILKKETFKYLKIIPYSFHIKHITV